MKPRPIFFIVLMIGTAVLGSAETFTVTTDSDSGVGSLREAIATAVLTSDPHTIIFDADYTINLVSALPTITAGTTITVEGNGWDRTVIDGGNPQGGSSGVRPFQVEGSLTLDGVGLQNCYANFDGGAVTVSGTGTFLFLNSKAEANRSSMYGGAVYSTGSITIQNSHIKGNNAGQGGGIFSASQAAVIEDSTVAFNVGGGVTSWGALTVRRSLFQENQAPGDYGGGIQVFSSMETTLENSTFVGNSAFSGGALFCGYSCDLTIRGSTIAGNDATSRGGGIEQTNNVFDLEGSIVYDNTAGIGPDIDGTANSLGYNLIGSTDGTVITGDTSGNLVGVDPLLEPLADNGGPTETLAIRAGSPAIDSGPPGCGGLSTDQRGEARPIDGNGSGTSECDIGAFEFGVEIMTDGFETGDTTGWSNTVT